MSFAKRLKQRRIDLGLTSQFMASQIGVSPSTYFEWENGRQVRGEQYYEPLARILQMSLSELIIGKNAQVELNEHIKIIEEKIEKIKMLI